MKPGDRFRLYLGRVVQITGCGVNDFYVPHSGQGTAWGEKNVTGHNGIHNGQGFRLIDIVFANLKSQKADGIASPNLAGYNDHKRKGKGCPC